MTRPTIIVVSYLCDLACIGLSIYLFILIGTNLPKNTASYQNNIEVTKEVVKNYNEIFSTIITPHKAGKIIT